MKYRIVKTTVNGTDRFYIQYRSWVTVWQWSDYSAMGSPTLDEAIARVQFAAKTEETVVWEGP